MSDKIRKLDLQFSRLPAVSQDFFDKAGQDLREWLKAGQICKADFNNLKYSFPDIEWIDIHRNQQGQLYVQIIVPQVSSMDRSVLPAQVQSFPVLVVNELTKHPSPRFPEPGPE